MVESRHDSVHLPVMAGEVVRLLVTDPEGAYLDLTAGAGGHLKALSTNLKSSARLYGFDRDPVAVERTTRELQSFEQTLQLVASSYVDVLDEMVSFEDQLFDGILLDLGLSSIQLDDPERGFAFRLDGPLDMRFDRSSDNMTAADLVNNSTLEELTYYFRTYGEERQAPRMARLIVTERQKKMIRTTSDLVDIISAHVPPPYRTKTLVRLFQSLRIAVNHELEMLENVLPKLISILKGGGRIAVLTYHSLEDRIVKQFFVRESQNCICSSELPACVCNHLASLARITKRPLVPTSEEIASNPRARSAKLRVAERVAT